MAVLTVQAPSMGGLEPVYTDAAASGDTFGNQGNVCLFVQNGGEATIDLTFVAQNKCNQGHLHDLKVSVEAGKEKVIGPFEPTRFNDTTSMVHVNYSAVDSVKVAAIRL